MKSRSIKRGTNSRGVQTRIHTRVCMYVYVRTPLRSVGTRALAIRVRVRGIKGRDGVRNVAQRHSRKKIWVTRFSHRYQSSAGRGCGSVVGIGVVTDRNFVGYKSCVRAIFRGSRTYFRKRSPPSPFFWWKLSAQFLLTSL